MYYYRKRRIGNRVVSEYMGSGEFAEAISILDEYDREMKALEREERKRELEALRADDTKVKEICDIVRDLASGALLAVGYHTHKGQWRKRRNGQGHD